MLDKIKELLGNNWKAAVAGAVATLVALLTGMMTLPYDVAEMVVDEDVKAKICADEKVEEKAKAVEEADAGEADAGEADAGEADAGEEKSDV